MAKDAGEPSESRGKASPSAGRLAAGQKLCSLRHSLSHVKDRSFAVSAAGCSQGSADTMVFIRGTRVREPTPLGHPWLAEVKGAPWVWLRCGNPRGMELTEAGQSQSKPHHRHCSFAQDNLVPLWSRASVLVYVLGRQAEFISERSGGKPFQTSGSQGWHLLRFDHHLSLISLL